MDKKQVLEALQSNKSARQGARLSVTKVYTVHVDGDTTTQLPPQAIALIGIMFAEEATSWNEQELHDLIVVHTEISEKQSPWLVFKFYRQRLVDAGFLSIKG